MRSTHTHTWAAVVLCFATASVFAQTTTAKKPAHPAHPHAAAHTPAAPAVPVALTEEQISIAQIVHTGRVQCADGHSVTITPDAKINGAFDLHFGKLKYDVVPMPSKSGAIRLEDSKTGIVYMQLANKSMLFNERQSKRLADDCIGAAQKAVADAMRANPMASVLDSQSK